MNNKPAQRITDSSVAHRQPSCPCQDTPDSAGNATIEISAHQLRDIAELLEVIDGFLRSDTIAHHLTIYLHTTAADQPRLPHGTRYNTGLLIDQISLNAHNLRAHQRKPLQ